jgi:hypothetical protein
MMYMLIGICHNWKSGLAEIRWAVLFMHGENDANN